MTGCSLTAQRCPAPDEPDQVPRLERFRSHASGGDHPVAGCLPKAWLGGRKIERPTLRGLLDELEAIFPPDTQASLRGPRGDRRIRHDTPKMARIYDYWLGGKDNYAADRAEAERLLAIYPPLRDLVRENRSFVTEAGAWATRQGIGQFIDLGAGLPASPAVHEGARGRSCPPPGSPTSTSIPLVLSHARALLATSDGVTAIGADLRDPAGVLAHPDLRAVIEPVKPIAGSADPRAIEGRLTATFLMMGNATFPTVHVIMSKAAHRYRPRIEQFAISLATRSSPCSPPSAPGENFRAPAGQAGQRAGRTRRLGACLLPPCRGQTGRAAMVQSC